MEEPCTRCKGTGNIKTGEETDICESCGGYGTNSWIGNVMGKPDRLPVIEVVREIVHPFQWERKDSETIQKLNTALAEAFKDTNLILEVDGFTEEGFNLKGRRKKSV